jgi:hypothetical protein
MIRSLYKLEKTLIQFPNLQTSEHYEWIYQHENDIVHFLLSKFLSQYQNLDDSCKTLLQHLTSLGYLHKVRLNSFSPLSLNGNSKG